jgi:hypothetical protein
MLVKSLVKRFILWGVKRSPYRQRVVTFDDIFLFSRFEFAWRDERVRDGGRHFYRPPWWRPFNLMLHCWRPKPGSQEGFHDHPRWSITVCLRGRIWEVTPWVERLLKPGSIVIRSRKAIHAFRVPDEHRGKTWTLFIVGRRNHEQNTYVVSPRGAR